MGEAGDFNAYVKDYNQIAHMRQEESSGEAQGSGVNFAPVAQGGAQSSLTSYTTRAEGETLQTIALNQYGDASLWHIIAEANGLSGTEQLAQGTRLSIPAAVFAVTNDAYSYNTNANGVGGINGTLTAPIQKDATNYAMQTTVTVVIEVVAMVAGAYGGPLAYAAVKQVGNHAAGRQEGWNWQGFITDAVTYAATPGGGTAGSVGQAVGQGALKAFSMNVTQGALDLIGDELYGNDQHSLGKDWTWEGTITDTAVGGAAGGINHGLNSAGIETSFGDQHGKGFNSDALAGNLIKNIATAAVRNEIAAAVYGKDYKRQAIHEILESGVLSTTTEGLTQGTIATVDAIGSSKWGKAKGKAIREAYDDYTPQVVQDAFASTGELLTNINTQITDISQTPANWMNRGVDKAGDLVVDLFEGSDANQVTNQSNLSRQSQQAKAQADVTNSQNQMASVQNQRALQNIARDQQLINGNLNSYYSLDNAGPTTMSTDIDPLGMGNELEGLANTQVESLTKEQLELMVSNEQGTQSLNEAAQPASSIRVSDQQVGFNLTPLPMSEGLSSLGNQLPNYQAQFEFTVGGDFGGATESPAMTLDEIVAAGGIDLRRSNDRAQNLLVHDKTQEPLASDISTWASRVGYIGGALEKGLLQARNELSQARNLDARAILDRGNQPYRIGIIDEAGPGVLAPQDLNLTTASQSGQALMQYDSYIGTVGRFASYLPVVGTGLAITEITADASQGNSLPDISARATASATAVGIGEAVGVAGFGLGSGIVFGAAAIASAPITVSVGVGAAALGGFISLASGYFYNDYKYDGKQSLSSSIKNNVYEGITDTSQEDKTTVGISYHLLSTL